MKKIICLILSLSIMCSSMSVCCFADGGFDVSNIPNCKIAGDGEFCLSEKALKKFKVALNKCKNAKELTKEQVESCVSDVYKNLDFNKTEDSALLLLLSFIKVLLKKGVNISVTALKCVTKVVFAGSIVVLICGTKGLGYILKCAGRVPSAVTDILTGHRSNKISNLEKNLEEKDTEISNLAALLKNEQQQSNNITHSGN